MFDKINNILLPNALMIGVDYDLFWSLNPKSLTPFIKAFELKQKYDDSQAWLHGMYIKLAITSSLSKSSKYPIVAMSVKDDYNKKMSDPKYIKAKLLRNLPLINSKFRKEE